MKKLNKNDHPGCVHESLLNEHSLQIQELTTRSQFKEQSIMELKEDINHIGFSAISQYCYVRIFSMLQKEGIKFADLGGSELEELNTFKKQLGAVLIDTYWAIKIC